MKIDIRYGLFGMCSDLIKLSTDAFQKHAATYKSLYGQRFDRLLVVDDLGFFVKEGTKTPAHYVKCICSCGNPDEIIVKTESLKRGYTRSCGCLAKEVNIEKNTKHGLHKSKIYRTYYGMLDRCNNPNSINYYKYGERGITVCEEWKNNFMAFYEWSINNGFADNLSIDRIDVNGNYDNSHISYFVYCL